MWTWNLHVSPLFWDSMRHVTDWALYKYEMPECCPLGCYVMWFL
jgi:hypothetical protein